MPNGETPKTSPRTSARLFWAILKRNRRVKLLRRPKNWWLSITTTTSPLKNWRAAKLWGCSSSSSWKIEQLNGSTPPKYMIKVSICRPLDSICSLLASSQVVKTNNKRSLLNKTGLFSTQISPFRKWKNRWARLTANNDNIFHYFLVSTSFWLRWLNNHHSKINSF